MNTEMPGVSRTLHWQENTFVHGRIAEEFNNTNENIHEHRLSANADKEIWKKNWINFNNKTYKTRKQKK